VEANPLAEGISEVYMHKPSSAEELVPLGYVARAQGTKGELRIALYNLESSLLCEQTSVVLRRSRIEFQLKVERARSVPKGVILKVEGCDSRDAAEKWRGAEVCVARMQLPKIEDEDEYYFVDLEGLEVRTENSRVVGRINRVIEYPTVSCFEIEVDGKSVELPFMDRFIRRVDLKSKVVWITLDAEEEVFGGEHAD